MEQSDQKPPVSDVAAGVIGAMGDVLARNWGWVMLRGVLGIIIGVLALAMPMAAIGALVLLFAFYAIADGIVAIVSAVRAASKDQRWGWYLVSGLVSLGAAAVALFMPIVAVKVFLYIMAFWAILGGTALIIAAFKLDIEHGRWVLILGGALSVLWGVLLLFQPAIGALVLAIWFGVYTLTFGIILVVLAFKLRSGAEKLKARAG